MPAFFSLLWYHTAFLQYSSSKPNNYSAVLHKIFQTHLIWKNIIFELSWAFIVCAGRKESVWVTRTCSSSWRTSRGRPVSDVWRSLPGEECLFTVQFVHRKNSHVLELTVLIWWLKQICIRIKQHVTHLAPFLYVLSERVSETGSVSSARDGSWVSVPRTDSSEASFWEKSTGG